MAIQNLLLNKKYLFTDLINLTLELEHSCFIEGVRHGPCSGQVVYKMLFGVKRRISTRMC